MKALFRRILLVLAAVTLLTFWGCSQLRDIPCTTEQVYTQAQLRGLFPDQYILCADLSYSEVNSEFAEKWHDYMTGVMSFLGSPARWNERLDCNRFVMVKLAVIHVRYLVDTWHSWKAGQAPAAGECWYTPDSSLPDPVTGHRAGHAVVVAIERGQVVYRDIYTAKKLPLSATELASRSLIKF